MVGVGSGRLQKVIRAGVGSSEVIGVGQIQEVVCAGGGVWLATGSGVCWGWGLTG